MVPGINGHVCKLIHLILTKLVLHSCTTIQWLLILNSSKILLLPIDFPFVFFVIRMEPDKSCSQESLEDIYLIMRFLASKISCSFTLRDFSGTKCSDFASSLFLWLQLCFGDLPDLKMWPQHNAFHCTGWRKAIRVKT